MVEGRSLRSIETAPQFRTTSTIGPGYYDAASSKDKTQSRRLQQPVISNWKQGHTSKAECLSVTLLAGFHWKQKVPRLGEGDEQQQKPTGEDGQKPRPGWSPSPPPIVRTTMAPESYERYRQEQVRDPSPPVCSSKSPRCSSSACEAAVASNYMDFRLIHLIRLSPWYPCRERWMPGYRNQNQSAPFHPLWFQGYTRVPRSLTINLNTTRTRIPMMAGHGTRRQRGTALMPLEDMQQMTGDWYLHRKEWGLTEGM